MTSATETILLGGQDPTTEEVLVLALHVKRDERVHHVLELVGASHTTGLGHLTNHDHVDEVLLSVVGEVLKRTFRGSRGDATGLEVPVVQGLERVHDQEEGLARILGASTQLVALLDQLLDIGLLTSRETATEAKPLDGHLELIEALLCSIEEDQRTAVSQLVRQLQHHGGLTGPWGPAEEGDSGRGKALAAESVIEEDQPTAVALAQVIGHLDVEDVGSDFDSVCCK